MEKIWLKNYPKGVPHEIDASKYNSITELFEQSCQKYQQRAAFVNMGAELSYADLNDYSADFASFFQNVAGLKKGDRIAIQMPNLLQYPIVLFAALRAGLVVVNTNPLYTARELKHQFKDSGVKAVVILETTAHLLEEILPETEIKTVVVTTIGDMLGFPKSMVVNAVVRHVKKMVPSYKLPGSFSFWQALDLGAKKAFQPVAMKIDELALLQYTGGTTGVSKGAMLSHRNLISNMLQILEWMKISLKEGQETVLLALPMYHIFSFTVNGLGIMSFGGTNLMITNPRDIPAFIKTLRKYKVTVFIGLNTLFNALMNHSDFGKIDFTGLKTTVAGGMALQKAVAMRWHELTKCHVAEGYGLTETSPVVCCNPINGQEKVGTIGLPLPSTEIKFVDDDGKEITNDEGGEICVRGPQVMQGYWQSPAETAKVMLDGGWLKTGDIAKMDDQGFFRIVDRKKDMIIVSGFNVYPNEIEDVIAAHPKVQEVAAIGVPDARSTEVVKVFIVPKDPSLTAEEIIKFCEKSLTGYKVPKFVEMRKELPKTNVGKILRRALRDEDKTAKPL